MQAVTPIPIILDTDIGTDIDDAYALVFAAASPELELRGVTTVNNDTKLRARIAVELLRRMAQSHIPVAIGNSAAITPGATRGWMGHEGGSLDLSRVDLNFDSDSRSAARFIADEARRCHHEGNPLTLVTIGAMTNAALAFQEYPKDMALIGSVVAMASSFSGYGQENRQAGTKQLARHKEA